MITDGKPAGVHAVCEQREWEEMEQARPGQHTLIRKGIASEAEAEALARSTPGGTAPHVARLKAH